MKSDNQERYDVKSWQYEAARKVYSVAVSSRTKGKKFSEESKKKMSEAAKKRLPMTDEIKKKISETLSGKPTGRSPMKGKPLSAETKAKISSANKGKPKPLRSEEHCRRLSESKKGKKHSEESKKNMSNAQLLLNKLKRGEI
jgi:hypothetical protein